MEKLHTIPVLDHGFVRYIDHMGSDAAICKAARISYGKQDAERTEEADRKLINRLYRDKHSSPFEMGKIVFGIKLPIFVMRQFVRHRMQNLNEISARYTELPNEFYMPLYWRFQSQTNKQGSSSEAVPVSVQSLCTDIAQMANDRAYASYQALLHSGVAREMARMVLPVSIYTEIVCCWDMSNLLKFFKLRQDTHAQSEIRDYSTAMVSIAVELFPGVMEAYIQNP